MPDIRSSVDMLAMSATEGFAPLREAILRVVEGGMGGVAGEGVLTVRQAKIIVIAVELRWSR